MGTRGKKSNSSPDSNSTILIDDNSTASLLTITQQMATFGVRFDKLELMLADVLSENKELKKALEEKDKEIAELRRHANDQEQYMRSWSICILDLGIPTNVDSTNPEKVMELVYEKVLLPILNGAVQKHLLTSIPPVSSVLETAHLLPAKPNQTPPIIARFYSRNIKVLIFRLKKEFSPTSSSSSLPNARPKITHPFFEDLTRANFAKMRSLANDDRVLSSWSVAGQLRFRLINSTTVHKVPNIFSTNDSIINSATSNT